jgi:hypothetical protein
MKKTEGQKSRDTVPLINTQIYEDFSGVSDVLNDFGTV